MFGSSRGRWRTSTGRGRGGFQRRGGKNVAAAPCRWFTRPGSCRYGENCKYSHDLTEGENAWASPPLKAPFDTEESDEERLRYYDWKSLVREDPSPLRYNATPSLALANLWSAGVKVLDGEAREWHQMLVQDLVALDAKSERAGYGDRYLSLTLRTKPDAKDDFTLRLIQDFLRVITHPSLLDCLSIETRVGTLYSVVSGANGERAVSFFMGICTGLVKQQLCHQAPERSGQCLEGMLDTLSELLRRERRASIHPDLPTLLHHMDEVVDTLEAGDAPESHSSQPRREKMIRLRRAVDLSTSRLAPSGEEENTDILMTNPFKGDGQVFPVELDPPGGRHDNNHYDITEIKILPTPQEISSTDPNYLPSTDCRQPHFLHDPVQRYLDTHFRLLRHDIFGPLKDILGDLMLSMEHGTFLPSLQRREMSAHVYPDACIAHITLDPKRGFEAHVSFTPPPQLKQKSAAEKRRWWENSKRLEQGGLVCLVFLDGEQAVPLLLIVTNKCTDPSQEHGSSLVSQTRKPTISTKLATLSRADLQRLIRVYQRRLDGILVDLPGLIPATFVPILENLQRMAVSGEIPFREWIVPDSGKVDEDHGGRSLAPPRYARKDGFSFSLESIVSGAAGDGGGTLSISPWTSPDDMALIDAMEGQTGLDRGQCQAMVAALTREFALIQGPPGTGKSYLGVKLLRVLLGCKKEASLGPIIIM